VVQGWDVLPQENAKLLLAMQIPARAMAVPAKRNGKGRDREGSSRSGDNNYMHVIRHQLARAENCMDTCLMEYSALESCVLAEHLLTLSVKCGVCTWQHSDQVFTPCCSKVTECT
jgi:hypothetical protein